MFRPLAALATIAVLAAGIAAWGDDNESSVAAVAKAPEPSPRSTPSRGAPHRCSSTPGSSTRSAR
jgi:hypothetical protein